MSKLKVTVMLSSLIMLMYACTKESDIRFSNQPTNSNTDTVYGSDPSKKNYDLTENFEYGIKAAYNSPPDTATLSTGIWTLTDALLNNSTSDAKDGSWSARIESTGTITTNFNINGLQTLYISSALFTGDAASAYTLQISTDSGQTFSTFGSAINVTTTTLHKDSFAVNSTVPVRIRIVKSSSGKRINIDDIEFKGTGNPGFSIDTSSGVTPPSNYDDDTTPRYVVVTANDVVQPLTGDNSNILLGNPSNADSTPSNTENHLFDQHYYIESYSMSQGKPNWTAWHLGNEDIGSAGRGNDFAGWAGLPSGWYQVRSNDYTSSGYDRGHNCPSADRTSTTDANDATFLMTNMMPQAANNNQGPWEHLEDTIRTYVSNGNEAYIYCGSYGNSKTIDNGHVTVPTNTWKVAVVISKGNSDISRISSTARLFVVDMPNTNNVVKNSSWKLYITTVANIEKATGYSFFTNITDENIRSALKTKNGDGN
ncbi:MAG: DNA/RNA non-specific endonuclease [Arachidicoccus sp.]|nr:DNA/RNA non-specific endonuclease [Arachidicoccus sp.]